jgi:hypothetical protein
VKSLNNIKELLDNEKNKLENIQVPEEMENKLRNSLDNIGNKKKKSIRGKATAMLIIVLLLGYNMDTLAYYGKQLVGYENVMDGNLSELNKLEKGQIIDKSFTFSNGVKATLDGLMLDDNKMIVFYSIYDPKGDVMDLNIMGASIVGSFNSEYVGNGQGMADESLEKVNWVMSYDSPKFYDKKMKIQFTLDNEHGEIPFELDRNKAMGHSLKIAINQRIELDERHIIIKSLMASPTSTVVEGQIQNILELGMDYIKEERFRPENISIELIADDTVIEIRETNMSTNLNGIHFNATYGALPEEIKNIELKLLSFSGDHDTEELVELIKGESKKIKVLDQDISIDNVYEEDGKTYITITTEESLILSRVYLNIDGERKDLIKTLPDKLDKKEDELGGIISSKRTLEFEGIGENLELNIERIRYNKEYNKTIYTYENK